MRGDLIRGRLPSFRFEMFCTMILRVVLYGCETWSLKSAEKHGPNIYENRVSGKSLVSTKVEVK